VGAVLKRSAQDEPAAADPLDWTGVGRRLSSLQSIPPAVDASGLFGGRFKIGKLIARGGVGNVWEAQDKAASDPQHSRVALKVMHPQTTTGGDDGHERFRREAAVASALVANEFAKVVAVDVESEQPFIAFERLMGQTLEQTLRERGCLSVAECTALLAAVARGLDIAHSFNIVHRDIHPKHLFLVRGAAPGAHVKILDFGVAKTTSQQSKLTKPGKLIGTAHYISPEQVRSGRAVSKSSDFWSLGAVLYRCLLGRLPFEGKPGELLIAISKEPHPQPSSFASVPAAIDEFFAVALCKDAARRFKSGAAMLQEFVKATASLSQGAAPGTGLAETEDPDGATIQADRNYRDYAALASAVSEPANANGSGVRPLPKPPTPFMPRPVSDTDVTLVVETPSFVAEHVTRALHAALDAPIQVPSLPPSATIARFYDPQIDGATVVMHDAAPAPHRAGALVVIALVLMVGAIAAFALSAGLIG
jgi:eukaryotic-like serine/threonine-protein kinase